MKVRILAALTSVLMLATATGCVAPRQAVSPENPPKVSPKVLKVAHYLEINTRDNPDETSWDQLLLEFTRETGVEIQYEFIPWDQLDQKLVITNQTNEPIGDVFMLSSQKLSYLVNARVLLPLDSRFERDFQRSDFNPKALEACTYHGDGKLYMMMQLMHIRGIWYNKNYVEEPPETWAELIDLGKQISRPEDDFYAFGFWGGSHYGSSELTLSPFSWALGGNLAAEDGRAIWDNPGTRDAIRFISDCVNVYQISSPKCVTTRDFADIQQDFRQGRLAIIQDGNFSLIRHLSEGLTVEELGFAPCPGPEGPMMNFSNGWAWGIPSQSKQPDLAWDLIKWFMREDVQIKHSIMEGGLPVRVSAYEDEAFQKEPFPWFLENLAAYGRPGEPFIYYQEGMNELAAAASTYCQDPTLDLEVLLRDSADQYNKKYY